MALAKSDKKTEPKDRQPNYGMMRIFFPLFQEVEGIIMAFLRKHHGSFQNTFVRGKLSDVRLIVGTPHTDDMTHAQTKDLGHILHREIKAAVGSKVELDDYWKNHADVRFVHDGHTIRVELVLIHEINLMEL